MENMTEKINAYMMPHWDGLYMKGNEEVSELAAKVDEIMGKDRYYSPTLMESGVPYLFSDSKDVKGILVFCPEGGLRLSELNGRGFKEFHPVSRNEIYSGKIWGLPYEAPSNLPH